MTPAIDAAVRFIVAVLFNGLWEAALLALMAWIALRVMPNVNATTRHSVLVAALLASLFLPIATASVTVVRRPAGTIAPATAHRPSVTAVVKSPPSFTASAPAIAPPARVSISVPRPLALAIVLAWLAGALFVLVRLGISLLHLERLKKDALPVPIEYRKELARWNAATKGSRTVRLCRSHEIAIPIAVGLFDAMILIPERFLDELEPADVDRIVLHELAHLRRADDWINAIERIASALLFFNPGIAWLVAQLDLEREVACDDWVLQQNDPLPYANCLAKVVESAVWPYRAMSAPGAFLTRRAMSVRIERLLTKHRDVRVRTSLGPTGTVIAAVAVLGICAAFVSPSFAYTIVAPPVPASTVRTIPAHRLIVAQHPSAQPRAAQHPAARRPAPTPQPTVVERIARQTAAEPAPAAVKSAVELSATAVKRAVGVSQVATNSSGYVDELAGAGYTGLTVDELIELHSIGITAEYIRGIEAAGLPHPTASQLMELKSLDVQPDYVRAMHRYLGDHLDVESISSMKSMGVTAEYVGDLASAGYAKLSPHEIMELYSLKIDGAFIRKAATEGFHNLTVDQLVRLKSSGTL
jgi:beta-lactamase regulating signal transducer with metallopeptidase domain